MTYCVALRMDRGLVFMSDTRTNAGVDNVSVYRKMHTWTGEDRFITLLSKAVSERTASVLAEPSMFQVARLVGETLKEVIKGNAMHGQRADSSFNATLILGGQIGDGAPRLFLIYPEGNFIEASDDTPFLQVGETKYGRPILVRAFDPDMSFEDAIKLLLVSFDSTIKANLSVGLPIDYLVYETDRFAVSHQGRIEADDPYFQTISSGWGDALRTAFDSLPPFRMKS
jgi:putative proteasome-type protease